MPRPRKLGPADEAALCARYLAGETVMQLGPAFGLDFSTAAKILKRNGISSRPRHALTDDAAAEVVRRYTAGETSIALAAELGIDPATVRHTVARAGGKVRRRPHLTADERKLIAVAYERTSSTRRLAAAVGHSRSAVRKALRSHGVQLVDRPPATYQCDAGYFRKIDTEQKAYWLGFIAADGNVHRHTLTIGLSAKDWGHLEALRGALRSTHPIAAGRTMGWRTRPQGNATATLSIPLRRLVDDLVGHGITPRKSLTLQWPTSVPGHLLRHYLRGYIDGDGSLKVTPGRRTGSPNLRIEWIGAIPFLDGSRDFLERELGVGRVAYWRPRHKPDAPYAYLGYGGRRQVERLYRLLYDGATVWLERKRAALRPWIETEWKTNRVLTPTIARAIRHARLVEGRSLRELAERYGVTISTVCDIAKGRTWAEQA